MATYRFLQPHYINSQYFEAGQIATTSDVGGPIPSNWKPSNNVDPLDAAAVNAFWAQGPQIAGLARQPVAPPTTYWKSTPGTAPTLWQLTGLGSALAPKSE